MNSTAADLARVIRALSGVIIDDLPLRPEDVLDVVWLAAARGQEATRVSSDLKGEADASSSTQHPANPAPSSQFETSPVTTSERDRKSVV